MGNIDSMPIMSQAKSLIQAITGDVEGAKQTQENFLHTNTLTAPWVLFHNTVQGNHDEALKVVEKFRRSQEETPVGGLVSGLAYHMNGEHDRGRQVLKDTTKTLGEMFVASIPCAPGGPKAMLLCAAGATISWDSLDFENTSKNKGTHGPQIEALAEAKATERYRRSVAEEESLLFCPTLPEVPAWVQEKLPTSLIDGFAAGEAAWNNQNTVDAVSSTQNINAVMTIFLVLKLMISGHPRSKPYYDEICRGHSQVDRCEQLLFESLNKYGDVGMVTVDGEEVEILDDSLGGLMYGMREMERSTLVGQGLMASLCDNEKSCLERLKGGLLDVAAAFKNLLRLGRLYRRVKRGCRSRGIILQQKKFAEMFKEHHATPKNAFEHAIKRIKTVIQEGKLPKPEKGVTHSTIIERDDLPNLRAKESPVPDFPGQFDAEIRYILHDIPNESAILKIGTVRYVRDPKTGEIVHMIGPQSQVHRTPG